MDQELWMKALQFHGPLLLQTILDEAPDLEGGTENDKLTMCKFIKRKWHLLFKPSDSPVSRSSTQKRSIPIVPIELFQNSSAVERRDLFYRSLDRGHILILQVINDTLPDNYKLLVLCKDEICMKLDDLSLVMYLPKLKAELDIAGGKLEVNDLIRAAVCSCSIDERKLYVTLDSNILEDEADNVKLGKISESDLPFYIGNVDFGSSYVEYLHHSPEFNNPNWAKDLKDALNIDRQYLYSFLDGFDGKTFHESVCGAELKKKQTLLLSKAHYEKAILSYKNGNFHDAFLHFNSALNIYPKNIDALVSRGILYANVNDLKKAFADMEAALRIDPNHENARKQSSILLVSTARKHIEQNNIPKASESIDAALNLDSTNQDAMRALDEIKKKIASNPALENLEKAAKNKKGRISSSSSESSCSRKDELKERQEIFLEASTIAFLSSMKKTHHERDKVKKHRRHHHTHHKSRSKSPKRKTPNV